MSRTLTALLACWMAVAATGTIVSHRHAAPAGYAHGYGWLSVAPTGDAVAEARPHHHFVLAGIEFGAIPGSREQGDEAQVVSAGLPPDAAADDGPAPAVALAPVGWGESGNPHPLVVPAPLALPPVCDVARHARTGVLLS